MQCVGMVGLAHCVEVARFSHGGLGSWWGLHAAVGLVCSGLATWWDLRTTLGWRCGEVFVGQVGVEVGLACRVGTASEQCRGRDRVVAADLPVAKGGGGGHGLRVATWRRRGLTRLEGWDMGVGIMWWRGGDLRTRHVG